MLKANPHKNISSLVNLLTILAFISAIAIIALTGFGMHSIYSRQVINMAEQEAILITKMLIDHDRDSLFSRRGIDKLHLQVDPLEVSWLNQSFSEFLAPLDIVKIKIFSPDTRVIYSTDNAIIGEMVPQNKRLLRALAGEYDSHLETKEELRDLKDETAFNVDVVEIYIPIIVGGEILGVFELYLDVTKFRKEIRRGTLQSLYLLASILLVVYLIAYSVARIGMNQVVEAEENLRNQAMIDALTGIFNRGELMSRAEEEMARITRHGPDGGNGELSLIMLDIDHFKQVNDVYGHQAGDAVLRQMPDRIKQGLRLYDILGRYGGEEFLILLPNADLSNASVVAERIRCSIADKPFTFKELSLAITVSLGISSFKPGINLTESIGLADQALYLAKQNGRNRVEHLPLQDPEILTHTANPQP